jgi:hypothetical protein
MSTPFEMPLSIITVRREPTASTIPGNTSSGAGALLDRLTHHVHILKMNGDSYRLNQSKNLCKGDVGEHMPASGYWLLVTGKASVQVRLARLISPISTRPPHVRPYWPKKESRRTRSSNQIKSQALIDP